MAVTTITTTMVAGVKYTVQTDSSADWGSVSNDVYFYDLAEQKVYYKDTEGIIINPFTRVFYEKQVAVSDETTALTTGTAKLTFRMPHAMKVTDIRASVTTAPTGADLLIGVNTSGGSIINDAIAPLRIDATEKTSVTAANQPQITTSTLNDDEEMIIDIDQVGSTVAGAGLKVTLIGYLL